MRIAPARRRPCSITVTSHAVSAFQTNDPRIAPIPLSSIRKKTTPENQCPTAIIQSRFFRIALFSCQYFSASLRRAHPKLMAKTSCAIRPASLPEVTKLHAEMPKNTNNPGNSGAQLRKGPTSASQRISHCKKDKWAITPNSAYCFIGRIMNLFKNIFQFVRLRITKTLLLIKIFNHNRHYSQLIHRFLLSFDVFWPMLIGHFPHQNFANRLSEAVCHFFGCEF